MGTDSWLAISAGATFLLALAAFWAIWQNYQLHKKERKQRLLNEIIEWATEVAKYSIKTGVFDETIPISGLAAERALPELLNNVVDFRMSRTKSVYILNIVSDINPELKTSIDNLNEEIKKQIKLLMEYKRKLTPTWPADQVVAKIAGNNERIYGLATELIEEAAKIKTTDIGKKEKNMSKESEATGSNEPTLKDIDDHLNQQDKQIKKSNYLTGSVFGAAIALVGLSFMVQISFQLSPYVYVGFFIVVGLGFMFWCRWKQSKIK